MKKDSMVFIQHIFESIKAIEEYSKNLNKTDFLQDKKTQDAIIRRLQIIGEAVKNLDSAFVKKYSQIPWSKIARMRDKLTHAYFGVDLEMVFDVVEKDIPFLKKELKKIGTTKID